MDPIPHITAPWFDPHRSLLASLVTMVENFALKARFVILAKGSKLYFHGKKGHQRQSSSCHSSQNESEFYAIVQLGIQFSKTLFERRLEFTKPALHEKPKPQPITAKPHIEASERRIELFVTFRVTILYNWLKLQYPKPAEYPYRTLKQTFRSFSVFREPMSWPHFPSQAKSANRLNSQSSTFVLKQD